MMEVPTIELRPPPGAPGPLRPETVSGQRATSSSGSSIGPYVETCTGAGGGPQIMSPAPAEASARAAQAATAVIVERPLGLWAAAGVHQRAFGRRSGGRIVSAINLLTSSWRVEQPHAVATLMARDAVSLLTWCLLAVLSVAVLASAMSSVMLGSIVAIPLVAGGLGGGDHCHHGAGTAHQRMADGCGASRRTGRDQRGCRPEGAGARHRPDGIRSSRSPTASAVTSSWSSTRPTTPRSSCTDSCGFIADKNLNPRRMRMVRAAERDATVSPPSWLVPIRVGIFSAVASSLALAVLVILYWGTPAVWLMAPVVVLGSAGRRERRANAAHPQPPRRRRGLRDGVDPRDRRRCYGRTARVAGVGRGGALRGPAVRQPRPRSRSKRSR